MGAVRLLTDPLLGRRAGFLRRIGASPAPHLSQRLDAVLVSHLHGDHADPPSLRRLGRDVPILAPPAAARWLRRRRYRRVRELGAGDTSMVGDVTVTAVQAVHDGRRWPRGEEAEAVGFLIEGPLSVYFAGDTDLFPEMEQLAGRTDVALLPIWGWGPSLGPGHLDPERAAEAAAVIRPGVAIPIHWGTLAPPWTRPGAAYLARPAREFEAAAARIAPGVDVLVVEPGRHVVVRARSADTGAPRSEPPAGR